jgi:hypothetical protein
MSDTIVIVLTSNSCDMVTVDESGCSTCPTEAIVVNDSGYSAVFSVNGKIGTVVLTKHDIGLGEVDNTSDLNKPLSYACLSALALKANLTDLNILSQSVDDFYVNTNTQVKRGNEAYLYYSPNSAFFISTYTNISQFSATYLSGMNTPIFQAASGYWDQAYSNLLSNSALYLEGYKVLDFTKSNFLYLSGGTITGDLNITTASDPFNERDTNGSFLHGDNNIIYGKLNHLVGDNNISKGDKNIIFGNNNIIGYKIPYIEYQRFDKSFKFPSSITSLFGVDLKVGNRFLGYANDLNKSFDFLVAGYDVSSDLIYAESDTIGNFSTDGFLIKNTNNNKIIGSKVIVTHENVIALNAVPDSSTTRLESTKDNQLILNAENGIYVASNIGIKTDNTSTDALNVNGSIRSNDVIYDKGGNSTNWNSNYTTYKQNSATYATTQYSDSKYFTNSGGLISGDLTISNNLTIYGDISAMGTSYFENTVYTTTTSLCIMHEASTGTAVYIGSRGLGDILSLYDIDSNVEVFHVGGHNGSYPNVGVKTSTPNADFTVNGSISSNNIIYDYAGNSYNWNFAYNWVDAGIIDGGIFL